MRIVVIGGTGLVGSEVVLDLRRDGHEAVAAAPNTGVNTLTGEGLAMVLEHAGVVIDVSNSPSFEDGPVMDFFETSTRHILAEAVKAGVGHIVALSIVGSQLLPGSGYMLAKTAQERLIKDSSIPYSIVHSTQFFEFIVAIADGAAVGGTVRLPPVLFEPIAAGDVASTVSRVAVGAPLNGTVEVAGPEVFRLDEIVRRALAERGDVRTVVADPHARYFGTELEDRSLLPGDDAVLAPTRYEDWVVRSRTRTSST
jgi:uncharacterized protein YbjT (DUF2867 family)